MISCGTLLCRPKRNVFLIDSLKYLYKQMKEIKAEHSVKKAAQEKLTVETSSLKRPMEIKTTAGEMNREKGRGPDFPWMDGRKGGREGGKRRAKSRYVFWRARRNGGVPSWEARFVPGTRR